MLHKHFNAIPNPNPNPYPHPIPNQKTNLDLSLILCVRGTWGRTCIYYMISHRVTIYINRMIHCNSL